MKLSSHLATEVWRIVAVFAAALGGALREHLLAQVDS